MHRFAWGQGPVPEDYRAVDLPNTVCHVYDVFWPSMGAFHRRVQHPGQTSWTWYTLWKDLKNAWAGTPEYNKIKGLGIDEVIPNTTDLPALKTKMNQVWYWCDQTGLPKPDWVVAIAPGNPAAVDAIVSQLVALFGAKLWWAPQTYVGCYKHAQGELDYGIGQAKALVDRMRAHPGQHARSVYGINHAHQGPSCDYFNVYGSDPSLGQRKQEVYDRWGQLARHAADGAAPFGFFVWTPVYSSPLTRGDAAAVLASVGA
jgi:hypothetical protein